MKTYKVLLYGLFVLLVLLLAAGCGRNENDSDPSPFFGDEEPADTQDHTPDVEEPNDDEGPDTAFYFSYGLDENGFIEGIRALDYVEIFNHQALLIPADIHQISDEEIQEVLDDLLSRHSIMEQVTDRAVAYGDTINIDFVGSVDGVEFQGGSTNEMGMHVTIGETQFIDDFLYQLIGHMPGTVVYVEVTFPDNYPQEPSLEGAEALFITTINYIGNDVLPELTDEFVMENFYISVGWETVDELMDEIITFLQNNAIHQYVHKYLTTQVAVSSIPEHLIRHHEYGIIQQHTAEAQQFGMTLDDLLSFQGFDSVEDLIESRREELETEAKLTLILQAVAEDTGITASVQDVIDFVEEHFGSSDISAFVVAYGMPWMKQFVRMQMVREYIIEGVVLA